MLDPIFRAAFRIARRWAPSDRFLYPAARLALRGRPDVGETIKHTTLDGFRMALRLKEYPDGAIYFSVYEVRTIRLMRALLRSGDNVCDVGANIGYTSLHMGRAIGPEGRVFAFEPLPTNLERLRQTLNDNQFARYEINACGLGETESSVTFYDFGGSDDHRHALASMRPLYDGSSQKIICPVRRLDDVVTAPIRLIKIGSSGKCVGILRLCYDRHL